MSHSRPYLQTLIMATLIAGCSSTAKHEATLEILKNQSVRIEKTEVTTDVNSAISAYEELANSTDNANLNSKALRHLGDLEMQRIDLMFEQDKGHLVTPDSYKKAISWYQKLLVRFPDYKDREGVLYQLARAYEQSGQTAKAIKALKILSRDYPNSKRAAEANFRRGEILFQTEQYHKAELVYASVISLGQKAQFYEQSLFKYAWSIYKQERCVESFDAFFAILDLKLSRDITPSELKGLGFLSRSDIELINDVFRAISLCAILKDGPATIANYLENKPARIYEFMIYSKLGEHYLQQKREPEAAQTYSAFFNRAPWHPLAVLMSDTAIDIYAKKGLKNDLIPEKKEYFRRYKALYKYWKDNPHNNYFEHLARSDTASTDKMKEHLKVHLAELAKYHHSKAQKTEEVTDYQHAVKWYRNYLKFFPEGEDAQRINFLLAEALFEDKLYQEAAIEYERVAYKYGKHDKAAEAGYAALVSYSEQERLLTGESKKIWHRSALQSALSFAKVFPQDQRTPEVLAKAADELYESQRYDDAMRAAQTIIDRYPNSSHEIKRSALIILSNTQFELSNYEIAELFYIELRSVIDEKDPLWKEVRERLATCIYKQAEHFRAQGAVGSAIDEFKRLIASVPDSSARPIAEYDIATTYIILDEWETALEYLKSFKKNHPDHSLIAAVEEKIAVAYLRLAKPLEAASALEGVAKNMDDPQSQREALWQIAELYEKGGELKKAAINFVKYADEFPSPLEPAIEAMYRAGLNYKKLGRDYYYHVQLEKIYNANQREQSERTKRTQYLAAKSAFILAEPHFERYASVRLVEPIRKNMLLKNQLMKKALESYNKAAKIGVAEFTTAATFRIADMYADFSTKLMNSDRPTTLNDEELEQYEIMLEEQAFPFEEKAIVLHETNISRMHDNLFNQWIEKSISSLAKLMPARYSRKEKHNVVTSLQ